MKKQKQLLTWISLHPALNISMLDKLAGLPSTKIQQVKLGKQNLSESQLDRLEGVLKDYGYKG